MQNKANSLIGDWGLGTDLPWADCAKQTQFAPAGRNRWGKPHPTRAQSRQTNPVRPSGQVWCLERQTVRNKPNFRRSNRKGKCVVGRELWLIEHSIGPGKTKPIWASPAGVRGVDYAEQTQFLLLCRSGDRRSREAEACETKPISGTRPGRRGPIVRNEPNLARHGQGRVATGGRCETKPVPATMPIRRSAFPGGQTCETKPIALGDPLKWAGVSDTIVAQATDLIRTD
jgi:hypothetical protein